MGANSASVSADVVGRCGAVDPGERVVDAKIAPVAVRDPHAHRGVAEEGLCLRALGGQLALELLLARDIGEVAVDVELAVVVAIDDADVAHPYLAAVCGRHPVLDGHLPVRLAQLARTLQGSADDPAAPCAAPRNRGDSRKSSSVKPKRDSICGLT